MRTILNIMFFVAAFVVTMALTLAYASDIMLACTQADGSVLYTNKDVKGCAALKMPELSTVPVYPSTQHNNRTLEHDKVLALPEIPMLKVEPLPIPSVVSDTCALYHEWVRINERTLGGFENNSVDDTKRRLFLTKIFGSGFSPGMCK